VVISAMRPPSKVDEGSSLHVVAGDQVEGDVDAAGRGGDGLDVRVHRPLVGGGEDGHLGRTAGGADVGAAASMGPWARPARKTAAPSRAKVLATPPPIPPPAR
jgi:hypothetical protein